MSCGNLDGLVEVGAVEKIEAGDPFLRLGKWTVGDQHLPLATPNGGGGLDTLETVPEDSHLPSVHLVDPIGNVVLFGHVALGFGVDAHEHQVTHGSPPRVSAASESNRGVPW